MNRRLLSVLSVVSVALAVTATGCWRYHRLPAPPVPARGDVPPVSMEGAPGKGLSRVVLDTVDGPAVVETIVGGSVAGVAGASTFGGSLQVARQVCVTPCVYDTSPGPQKLRFTLVDDPGRTSEGFINVDAMPSVYRHAVGRKRSSAWKGVLGWPVLALGLLVDLGFIAVATDDDFEFDGGAAAGIGFGVGATLLGGWLVYGSTIEEQPGSGVQYHLDSVARR
jgi:hypothetical protein